MSQSIEYNRESPLYPEISFPRTPLEGLFKDTIQTQFGSELSEQGFIDRWGRYNRTSSLVMTNSHMLGFQYTRLSPLNSHKDLVVNAYKEIHPEIVSVVSQDEEDEGSYQHMFDQMDERDEIENRIINEIVTRDGHLSQVEALQNLSYLPNLTLSRWPEELTFVIFHPDNLADPAGETFIGRRNRVQGKRPDVAGETCTFPAFENIRLFSSDRYDNELTLTYPRLYYDLKRAYDRTWGTIGTLKHDTDDYIGPNHNFDYDDVSGFVQDPIQIGIDSDKPEETVKTLTTFINYYLQRA